MLPESALHYQSIAFNRGGAPATAPMCSSTLGDTQPPRPLRGKSIEKGKKEGRTGGSTSTGLSLRNSLLLQKESTIVYIDRKLPAK